MSNLYRGPSIDASYQVSVHLSKRFQRKRFLKICIQINAFWIQISIFKQDLKQELPVVAMFVNGSRQNEQALYRTFHRCFLPSFGSFGQAISEEKIFLNRPIRNKNCLWWPCLLMDRDEMSNLYRGPSIDASYPISVHLGKRFQRRRFLRNQQIRNKNGLWWPYFLTDQDEMSNLYRGPSRNASYQVLIHLARRFQRRRFF